MKNKHEPLKILGENLKSLREKRRITLSDAALSAGMTKELLEQTEIGKPGISTLQITKLSRLYMTEISKLFESRI